MPRIDDESMPTKRPFKKKAYRPWHLLDEFDIEPKAEKQKENPVEKTVTINEPLSNQQDTNHKPISNQIVNESPTLVIKQEPYRNPTSNHISNQKNEIISNASPILVEVNAIDIIQRVAGLQRKILFYIVEDCILKGTLYSSPITTETLKSITNADTNTVKTATQRLINKNLISRGRGKKGKGGFAIFYIKENIRNAVIEAQKKENNLRGLVTNWVSNKESLVTYSSGSNIRATTNENYHENLKKNDLPLDWDSVNIEPLTAIGFTKSHLRQIILDDKLTIEMVQDSIYAFAFDLEKNNKTKQLKSAPLNYFMGILRSGMPYAPPQNYESPQDTAMRVYLERKREMNTKRQAIEDGLLQEAYDEWESNLSQEDKEEIFPDKVINSRLVSEKMAFLRNYFKEHFWPSIKKQYLIQAMG